MRSEYPEAFEGGSGELLERALEEIAGSDDNQYRKLCDDIQRRNDQRAALLEISNHRTRANLYCTFLNMAIAEAIQFQVAAHKIGEVIEKTAKTVREMRSEGQETTKAYKGFLERTLWDNPFLEELSKSILERRVSPLWEDDVNEETIEDTAAFPAGDL